MRIGVIGAGALGSVFAARLQMIGHDVQVITRGTQRDTIAAHGITLRGGFGDAQVRVSVVDQFNSIDLCLVCTKAHDTADALASYGKQLAGIPVLLVQNGIESFVIAKRTLAEEQLFGVISLIAANFTEAGVVTVTNPQPTFVGRGHGPADAESERIAEILNGAVPTTAIDSFEGALWTKLVLNMINALPALTGLPVQEVVQDSTLLRLLTTSMREAARIGIAANIPFARLHGLDETVVIRLANWPLWRSKRIPLEIARGMGSVPNLASTLQSIRRGRPTEIEFLNGAIVRTAELIGQDAPINRTITTLVHQVEATGVHLHTVDIVREFRDRGVRW